MTCPYKGDASLVALAGTTDAAGYLSGRIDFGRLNFDGDVVGLLVDHATIPEVTVKVRGEYIYEGMVPARIFVPVEALSVDRNSTGTVKVTNGSPASKVVVVLVIM